MKRLIALLILSALGFFCPGMTLKAAQTNLVQTLRFNLAFISQGTSTTNLGLATHRATSQTISNAHVIRAIGTSLSESFSRYAKLLVITRQPEGYARIVVQDGARRVDATGFFSIEKGETRVVKGTTNLATHAEQGTEYAIHSIRLEDHEGSPDLNLHFRVRGFTPFLYRSIVNSRGAVVGGVEEYTASVIGTGDLDGHEAVVRGTVSCTGRTLEVLN